MITKRKDLTKSLIHVKEKIHRYTEEEKRDLLRYLHKLKDQEAYKNLVDEIGKTTKLR